MIYYNSPYVTIKYFEKEKLVFTTYHGFTPTDELRKVLDLSLKLLSEKDVQLGLADNRKMKVIRPADQEYIQNEWFPKVLELSKIRKSATIESSDIFNKMARENILRKIETRISFEMQYFNSIEKACNWLQVDPKILDI